MIVDILVISILLISILISVFRGFIREVLTICGLIGATAAAYFLAPVVEPLLVGWLTDPNIDEPQKLFGIIPFPLVAKLAAYGGIFLIFMIALSFISHFLSNLADEVGLGSLDRSLGAVFGALRGALLIGLLYLPFYYFLSDDEKEKWFEKSHTHYYLELTSSTIDAYIPSNDDEVGEDEESDADINASKIIKDAQPDRNDGNGSDTDTPSYSKEKRERLNDLIEGLNQ